MKSLKLLVFFVLSTMLVQCVSLNSVSMTQIPKERQKVVSASVSRNIFLFLNFDNDYVDELSGQLRVQCSGGVVSGILTKAESICYLPFCFIYQKKVTAKGYCQQ